MSRSTLLLLGIAAACGDLIAQSNQRGSGYDGALTNISNATDWGRRGAAYPNGEVGVSFQNQLCNPGSIPVEWREPGGFTGAQIQRDHPKFGFLVAKEANGRMVQLSDWSYCKHAFYALASPSTCGGTCQPPAVAGTQLGVSCSDIYSNGHNGDRYYLGPPQEINPWLGDFTPIGSYFDIGHAGQAGYPLAADGFRSNSTAGFDAVEHRVTLRESEIPNGGTMFFQIHVIHEGERVENRANNVMSRPFSLTFNPAGGNGTGAYTTTTSGTATVGSILTRWAGATITSGANGGTGTFADADGRFLVAVRVTGPVNGFWHYEYCVQNLDNHRGGASFRLPVCAGARVQNLGFRDIDQNALNNWTSAVGAEIAWTDNNNNPQNWNTLYNFWFDCDVAPGAVTARIDQARVGPGALFVNVPTTGPSLQSAVYLGDGCGTPAGTIAINGVPAAGNAAFAINITSDPGIPVQMLFSPLGASIPFTPACTLFLDFGSMALGPGFVTNGAGTATMGIPVPAGLPPLDLFLQGATFVPNPPILDLVGLTNGLKVRFASTGCN